MKDKRATQIHPIEEQIQQRAYELYLKRGCQPGKAIDDWLQAEYELRQLPIAKLAALKPVSYSTSRGLQASALLALVQAAMLV
ncbi:MAG: DUF2934 domain-containing protein [Verrucomicrobiota bacterium]|jgi:DNA-binding SARP family transcriptional activator